MIEDRDFYWDCFQKAERTFRARGYLFVVIELLLLIAVAILRSAQSNTNADRARPVYYLLGFVLTGLWLMVGLFDMFLRRRLLVKELAALEPRWKALIERYRFFPGEHWFIALIFPLVFVAVWIWLCSV